MKRLRVGVVYGGRSSEHEVSVASAAAVFSNLDPARYVAVPIYVQRDGRWSLADRPPTVVSAGDVIEQQRAGGVERRSATRTRDVHFVTYPGDETLVTIQREPHEPTESVRAVVGGLSVDVVFPVIHGPCGEDGTLQGLLELANVPYVGAGVLGSAVGMDKAIMKRLMESADIPVVPYWSFIQADTDVFVRDRGQTLPYPVFVKPANLGSSVGITKVATPLATTSAIASAWPRIDHSSRKSFLVSGLTSGSPSRPFFPCCGLAR